MDASTEDFKNNPPPVIWISVITGVQITYMPNDPENWHCYTLKALV